MVEDQAAVGFVRVLVEVIDTVGEQAGTALDAVHLVAFVQEEFGQVGAVLAGDAGDEGFIHVRLRGAGDNQLHVSSGRFQGRPIKLVFLQSATCN